LDDLKVNDTGELELGSDSKASGDLEKLLEIDEIKLDEIPLIEAPPKSKREARVVNAATPKKKGAEKSADDDLSLDWMTWNWTWKWRMRNPNDNSS